MNLKKIQCVYCGEFISGKPTRDHIPSKNLFTKGLAIKNPIIVNACTNCNNGFSFDEEYFRIFLVNMSLEKSFAADQLFYNEITRSFLSRPPLLKKVAATLKLVNLNVSGIDLGKKTAILFSRSDWQRYFHVLDKYIQGLYFHHTGHRYQDKGYLLEHKFLRKPNEQLAKKLKWDFTNREKFMYGTGIVPDTEQSIWYTVFFENVAFFSTIADKDFFEKAKLRQKQITS